MMTPQVVALYARVSSQQQKEEQTIDSQVAALREYAAKEGHVIVDEWVFKDEGYSGAVLRRPALEALRDLAAQGHLDVVLVYSADRLARKYAYQVLLLEELRRSGVEVLFLNSSRGETAEDELLLQFQGMIAEYERAQIAERTRRGKVHRARSGDVSVLSGAPYGYRYVAKSDSHAAYYEIIESQAHVVRDIFRLYTQEGKSIGAIARQLGDSGILTRSGKTRWERSTIWAMLRNPAYVGRAAFAKTQVVDRPKKPVRGTRQRGGGARPAREERPQEQWIEIHVPAIIDETAFSLASEQLERNKRFAARRTKEPSLLQGLLVCRNCGYAYYRSSTRTKKHKLYYYRCLGSDNYRWEHGRVCTSTPHRQDRLDKLVWDAVLELLVDPDMVRQELERRLEEGRRSNPTKKRQEQLQREITRYEKASSRLIEAFQEELITLEELRSRIEVLRKKGNSAKAQLQGILTHIRDEESFLRLYENFETFLAKLRERAQTLSVEEQQKILRLIVKEIHVEKDRIIIKHSIPQLDREPNAGYPLCTRSPLSLAGECSTGRGRQGVGSTRTRIRPLCGRYAGLRQIEEGRRARHALTGPSLRQTPPPSQLVQECGSSRVEPPLSRLRLLGSAGKEGADARITAIAQGDEGSGSPDYPPHQRQESGTHSP